MKAEIIIQFEEINNVKIDGKIISEHPEVLKSTENAVKLLTEQMEKYFREKKIKIKTSFKVSK